MQAAPAIGAAVVEWGVEQEFFQFVAETSHLAMKTAAIAAVRVD